MKSIFKTIMFVSASVFIHVLCFANADNNLINAAFTGNDMHAKQALSNGADVNAKNSEGVSVLHIAAAWNDDLKDNAQPGKYSIVKMLIEKGADIHAKDSWGNTPLHIAAQEQNFDMVRLFIENGALINAETKSGSTPLHYTVSTSGDVDKLTGFLIKNGAHVTSKNKKGLTPLHNAAISWNKTAMKLLIKNGADANATDQYGQTPLHMAAQYGRIDESKFLLDHGAKITARTIKPVTLKSWSVTFPIGSTPRQHAQIVRKNKLADFLEKAELSEHLFQAAYKKYKKKNDKEAVILYEKAIKYYESGKIYYHYGNSLSNINGRLNESITAYNRAIELNFGKPHLAYYNIACAYSRMENKEKAYEYLKTAVKHGYKSHNRILKDSDLSYIRSDPDWEAFYKKLIK